MRKLYSFLFTVALLFACQTAWAYDFKVDGIYYTILSSSESLAVRVTSEYSSSKSYSGEVVIPSSVVYDGKTYIVKQIDKLAFSKCTNLTKVTIQETVTVIYQRAFSGCTGLTEINIPESVTQISLNAFQD